MPAEGQVLDLPGVGRALRHAQLAQMAEHDLKARELVEQPSNVPIILVDVTDVGVTLAKTTINSEGEFTFDLQTPLIKSHAVGLQIGDLSQTDFNYSDFTYGEDYLDRPLVGILFDMATIVDK